MPPMNRKLNNILIIILSLILISWVAYALIQTTDFDFNFNSNQQTTPPDTIRDNTKLPAPTTQLSLMEHDDKTSLLNYSYLVLDNYYKTNKSTPEFIYDRLFITIIHNGQIKCCQSGSKYIKENKLFSDVNKATVDCIEDERFGGVLTEDELPEAEIVFTYLFNKRKLKSNDLDYLEDNIELGIHAIEINNGGKTAYFKESVPITKNYDLEKTLERLCVKVGLDSDCYSDNKTVIYQYDTYTFKGDRENKIIDLYRYNILVDENEINKQKIYESISLSQDWYQNNINPQTGRLEYMYYPSSDTYSSKNNQVRQLASLWALTELSIFLNSDSSDALITKTFDHYLTYKKSTDDYAYFIIDDRSLIAYNAFMIQSLINTPNYPNQDILLEELANGLLVMQEDDGSFKTSYTSDEIKGVDYYPGEAVLSLMELYRSTGDERYINSVKKAFPYYRSYWRDNKNTAFIPWHSQTYRLLYEETEDPELAEFMFEINDWLIDNYQIEDSEYIDEIGGFPKNKPRCCSTSAYMEGINDAYAVALAINDTSHINKYANSIRSGTRFMLQNQFNDQNTFHLTNSSRAIGGFKHSLTKNDQRNDYTQHALLALIKTYDLGIFDQ